MKINGRQIPDLEIDKKLSSNWIGWEKYVEKSHKSWQRTNPEDLCNYPVQYLNDALVGIMQGELVVLAADTGCGKTELAMKLSFTNAEKGKKVALFPLESGRYEIAERERYRRIVKKCWELNQTEVKENLTYNSYLAGMYKDEIAKVWGEEDELLMSEAYRNLKLYKSSNLLNKNNFLEQVEKAKNADIIVIDHLHYFDFISTSEHAEITEIMKVIRQVTQKLGVPIVLVSHLRKKGKDRVFPDKWDLHGSSNIAKQANTVILLGKVSNEENISQEIADEKYPTGIRIAKSRTGINENLLGVVVFDGIKQTYEDNYTMKAIAPHGILDVEHYPKWAKPSVNWTEKTTEKTPF